MLRKPNFEQYLNDATDSYRLETDWDIIMKICDLIRQGDVKPVNALNAIQKKISNPNSVVALYGLTVLESCVKNCGALIQDEISTKQFMETFKDIIKSCPNENVKTKCLDLLQSWAFAFRHNPKHRAVQDTVTIMKTEGYKFPVFKESDAMFSADTAPSWKDGDRCHRCRTMFTIMNRKHHCRACGEVFCHQCSSHNITLPKFGIEKQVRVCDTCLEKCQDRDKSLNHNDSVHTSLHKGRRKLYKSGKSSPRSNSRKKSSGNPKNEDPTNEYQSAVLSSQNQHAPAKKTEEELKEEEELQLAIALSQSEAESKKSSMYKPMTRSKSFSPPITHKVNHHETDDVELSRYLNRSYWENKALSGEKIRDREEKVMENSYDMLRDKTDDIDEDSDNEIESFMNALRNQVEILVNRMKSNSSRGRSIANDTSVQTLFLNITTMHSRLLKYIQQQDDSRVYYEGLQDKLTQVKDARAALDALREEHKERLRREAEIAERQRQIQMAQKLEIMRQKKQEYLQYQRQLALKRIHDQERELHMRQEQQMQQYRLSNAYTSLPFIPPSQGGGISAFEPVVSMGMNLNMNSLPSATVSAGPGPGPGPFGAPSSFPSHYPQGQNVASAAIPSPPQQMTPSNVMLGQTQIASTNAYTSVNHPSANSMPPPPPPPPSSSNQSSGTGQQQLGAQYAATQGVLHAAGHVMPPPPQPQPQAVYMDSQNLPTGMTVHMDQNLRVIGASQPSNRVESNGHMVAPPPPHSATAASVIQHANVGRSMIPPSSSPLSSPSSSSEHSLIQHGPQPIPSAPSATSTPQPEEKEEMTELLISFD